MSRFTRLTLVGSARRAEVVVPSDEAFAAMLPQILELLDEPAGLHPAAVALVRVTGDQVDLALDAAGQGVDDGEVVRVVRASEAPPPPDVADVTDAAAAEITDHPSRWTTDTRQAMAVVVVGLGVAALSVLSPLDVVAGAWTAPLGLTAGAVGTAGLAAALGRGGLGYVARVLTALAVGLVPAAAASLAAAGAWPTPDAFWAGGLLLATTLGLGLGLGRPDRGVLAGAGLGATLAGAALVLERLGGDSVRAAGVVATVAVLALGLLPWYAMASSGLTGLDDQVLEGATPQRTRVRATLLDAYRALTASAVAVSGVLGVALAVLVSHDDAGALALGLVAVTITALRTRSLPLRGQVLALWTVVVVVVAALLVARLAAGDSWTSVLTLGGLLLLGLVLGAGARPSPQIRARLRRSGDVLELLCVLALLPLVLAVFGIFGDLLETFS